ncbi:MAG: YadA-like family protein [Caecibacter massiliensis]|nr:YadA-like family protein [Caecibacter massiliensis]
MKDGKVDKTHVTFEAVDEAGNPVDTQVSHMASGASEIKMDEKGRPISYVYDIDNNGANIGDVKNIAKRLDEEVTKRGLDFRGNDGKTVHRDLGTLLNLTGGLKDQDELAQATGKNLGVRQNGDQDGLEIVMTDTPDFTKVTVGEGTDTNSKITIGNQTVTGKKSDGSTADQPQTGNYITGLDNKAWDKDNVVENRAATEGQLKDAIHQISGAAQGGFGLADENGTTVKKDLGQTVTVKGDGKNIQTKVNGDALEVSLKKDVDLGTDGSVKAGNTTINQDGVDTNKVKVGGITITDQGINGGTKQITNIASGIDGKQYTDDGDNNAASIGDVKQLARNEAKASEARSGKNITVKDDHTVNLNDDITLGNDATKQVTVKGSEGQVTIGTGDNAMILGQQANGAGDNNPATGNFLNGLDNRNWDGEHIQNGRAATEDQLKTVSDKVDSGRIFQGDDGQDVTVGLGDTLKIQGGAREVSSDPNIGIVKGADDTLNVRLAKNLTGLNSVTTGNTTINNGGLTVKTGDSTHQDITIQQGDVNMGGNKIEGVAPGKISKDSTDAVNGSQLYAADQAISYLGGTVNKLGTRVDRVGAGSAALAALHPLDFDPDDKWDFAAGYGHYRGANAAAVGAYYRPNEDTMFSIGGSFGGGENMFNAGVSIKLGQGNHVSTSRVAMAKEMEAMRRHMAEQDALIAKLESMHGMAEGPEKSALFPDVAENHWAYQYVTTLAKKGILEGYPDGEFKGDRMMTRYEFAAIVYRIVESGVGSTDPELSKLVREFSPELQYIRIDTIHRDDKGQPTVQRVRVKDRK